MILILVPNKLRAPQIIYQYTYQVRQAPMGKESSTDAHTKVCMKLVCLI